MKNIGVKRYRITYKQKYMGKTLEGSFNRTVRDESELHNAINALYDDPHVYSVTYEELEEDAV